MEFLAYEATLVLWSQGTDFCEVTSSSPGVCSFFYKFSRCRWPE